MPRAAPSCACHLTVTRQCTGAGTAARHFVSLCGTCALATARCTIAAGSEAGATTEERDVIDDALSQMASSLRSVAGPSVSNAAAGGGTLLGAAKQRRAAKQAAGVAGMPSPDAGRTGTTGVVHRPAPLRLGEPLRSLPLSSTRSVPDARRGDRDKVAGSATASISTPWHDAPSLSPTPGHGALPLSVSGGDSTSSDDSGQGDVLPTAPSLELAPASARSHAAGGATRRLHARAGVLEGGAQSQTQGPLQSDPEGGMDGPLIRNGGAPIPPAVYAALAPPTGREALKALMRPLVVAACRSAILAWRAELRRLRPVRAKLSDHRSMLFDWFNDEA